MSELEERFNIAIKEANFNFLEIKGFQAQPQLALLAGMAIGYKMASVDIGKWLIKQEAADGD